jgi:hypothetical protein
MPQECKASLTLLKLESEFVDLVLVGFMVFPVFDVPAMEEGLLFGIDVRKAFESHLVLFLLIKSLLLGVSYIFFSLLSEISYLVVFCYEIS